MPERIYGLDTGGYDPKKIDSMADWELFLEYYSVTLVAWRLNHDTVRDHSRGYVSDEEYSEAMRSLEEMQYPIEYLLYTISKRNEIPVNEPAADKHIAPDREIFMKWYKFYDDHFIHEMSDDTWKEFEQKRKDGADISQYLPDGNWRGQ